MNSILLMVIGGILLLCIIILVVILKNLSSLKVSKTKKSSKLPVENDSNTHKNIPLFDIKDIKVPKKISSFDDRNLFKACKAVFDSFKALDYKNSSYGQVSKCEWHSWQVSLLIAFQKSKREFHVGDVNDVFSKATLEISPKALQESIEKIWKKYDTNVNINLDRDSLSNDIIWTSNEVSTMFHYMMKTKY